MSKKVIVTGCTGQDGSHMVDYLLKNTDYEIYGMVRRSAKPDYSNLQNARTNSRFKLYVADLSDSQSIDNMVKEIQPDYFINLGAQSFVGSSWQLPEQTFDVGAVGVLRCLEAIRKHCPWCRFYNAGSSEEVGDVEYTPQDENHPARPLSPYAAAKCAARGLVKVYRDSYNLYAIQGMLFNHEGTRRGEEFVTRKITKGVARIHYAFTHMMPFAPIELGSLDSKRDWSDAEDFVDGIWRMLNQENFRSELKQASNLGSILLPHALELKQVKALKPLIKEYVLSSNETHTVREFVELSFKEAGIKGEWRGQELEQQYVSNSNEVLVAINPKFYRPADVNLLHGDSTAARKDLQWNPKTSFPELVKKMVKNDIENYKL